ncbi:MAG: aminodeoxychorismate lyase [Sulfuricurvum sp. PC08-66]|nr:MAG: aminodeoxychorismate lyase [Sulfuricurvum sp. PC08-66]
MTTDAKNVKIITGTIETFLVLLFVAIFYLVQPVSSSRVIYVPQGSIVKIIHTLKEEVEGISTLDRHLVRLLGQPQRGWIDVQYTLQTKADFYYHLCHSKAAMESIILLPGETTYLFLQTLSSALGLDFDVLQAQYRQIAPLSEGFLIPQTYAIPKGIDAKGLIELLVHFAAKEHERLSMKLYGNYTPTRWKTILIIASIVEKEAANSAEMPLVASVIYNRLRIGMRLQMDGTLNYGPYSHEKVTPQRIRSDTTHYNTYKQKGLPLEPVCVVSHMAIKAAVTPAKSDFLYFMRNKNGTHDFTRYFSTHIKNIENVKK